MNVTAANMLAHSMVGVFSITYIAPHESVDFDVSVETATETPPKLASTFSNSQWEQLRSQSARRSRFRAEPISVDTLYAQRFSPASHYQQKDKLTLSQTRQAQRRNAKHEELQHKVVHRKHNLQADRPLREVRGREILTISDVSELRTNLFSRAGAK